jgi:ATP-dependent RNA helicase DeaD
VLTPRGTSLTAASQLTAQHSCTLLCGDPLPKPHTLNTVMTDLPTDPFAGVPAPLQASLARKGYASLTAIQQAVVSDGAGNRNLRLTSQTGSGKTVALGIAVWPAVIADAEADTKVVGPRVLIIGPTRELASQIQSELGWLYEDARDVRVEVVTGGTDVRAEQVRLRKNPRVLVGTPGRLLDHVRSGKLDLSGVQEVVLDEADQMLDMGFKDELDALMERLPETRRSHLVSATFPRAVQQLAERFQHNPLHLQGSELGVANHDIQHVAHMIAERDRYAALVNVLLGHLGSRCLVFVQRRVDAAEVAERLAADGFAALPISGDLPQAQRNRTLASFKTGVIDILVATDVAARGIHVDDIGLVIHGDLPKEPDVYTHRSGRTGRAGQQGKSILFVTPASRVRAERMLQRTRTRTQWEPLPSAKKIQQSVVKRGRRALHTELTQVTLEPHELEYAQGLLAQHSAEAVIGVLLRMASPKLPCEPQAVTELTVRPQPPPAELSTYPRRNSGPRGVQRDGKPGYGRDDRAPSRPAFATHAPRDAKRPAGYDAARTRPAPAAPAGRGPKGHSAPNGSDQSANAPHGSAQSNGESSADRRAQRRAAARLQQSPSV